VSVDPRPKPVPDIDTAPYWAAVREHVLRLQRCPACNRYAFPPKPRCAACLHQPLEWVSVSGRGKVRTFAIMRDTFMKAFPPPYAVAEVELEEQPGLTITTNIVECDVDNVRIGLPVEVTFEDRSPDVTIPQFRPR
jgi:uncharacterized OB-fold protein